MKMISRADDLSNFYPCSSLKLKFTTKDYSHCVFLLLKVVGCEARCKQRWEDNRLGY
ncbi:hypothetical protein Lser_V15G24872 [Lactuca serriola]